MDSGSENDRYGRINPGHVSYRPIRRHTSKSPPTTEIAGNIEIASAPARIAPLPGKSRREMAYAAIAARVSAITVAMSAMPIELTSAELKMPDVNTDR